MTRGLAARPVGIMALIIFFLAGTMISLLAGLSLVVPAAFFETMWRLNPRAHDSLTRIDPWSFVLMFAVSISCASAAIGLWRGARWGHRVAVSLIAINLLADVANVLSGTELRAIVGVPVAAAILIYLMSARVRRFFEPSTV